MYQILIRNGTVIDPAIIFMTFLMLLLRAGKLLTYGKILRLNQ